MRIPALLPTIFATSAVSSMLGAQTPHVMRLGETTTLVPRETRILRATSVRLQAVIGVQTNGGSTARDTLGLLVSNVRAGSPAEKAGVVEGDRIASVNGVSLQLDPADVGDQEMPGVMARRLSRVFEKLKPGDQVELHVNGAGYGKTMKVKTVAPQELIEKRTSLSAENRAALGVRVTNNGSSHDSIGVFVMSVDDAGPAAKAGIQEGSRIASINGVDLRSRDSGDDIMAGMAAVNHLERELSRLKPGDDVELRVFANGQYKNVKMKTARASELSSQTRTVRVLGGDFFSPDASMAPSVEVRRAMEAMPATTLDMRLGAMGPRGMSW